MKIFSIKSICFLLLFGLSRVRGNTYYFSSLSGDDSRSENQATHPETPWKSLNKLNSYFYNLKPGDSILFRNGEVFPGSIHVVQSGSINHPIVFSTYGNGKPAVITGFFKPAVWRPDGQSLWTADCSDCSTVRVLTINGMQIPMGRTPNADEPNGGYSVIAGHNKNQSFSDDQLLQSPDWTGADIVIRKNRFILDKNKIISKTGNTIQYKGGSYYEPTDGFGYFIQNDIRTLDRKGEWYYNPISKKLTIFYGDQDPSASDIRFSYVENLVTINRNSYLLFYRLNFQGSNSDIFDIQNSANLEIRDCSISFAGLNAIKAAQSNDMTFNNISVSNSNNNGIDVKGTNNLIQNCHIKNTGTIPGMGTGESSYIGINVAGNSNTVQNNEIDSTGYVPIFFLGTLNTIQNNFIRYFALVKDDGGGIYTWSGDIDTSIQRQTGIVNANIVLDGITAPNGTDNKHEAIAYGIYLDQNSGMIKVSGNTVSRCTGGIFLQDAHEVEVSSNTMFDNGFQFSLRHPLVKGTLRNNYFKNNIAVAKTGNQFILVLSSAVSGDVTSYASFDNNFYAILPSSQNSFYKVVTRPVGGTQTQLKGNFDQWKDKFGKDMNSHFVNQKGDVVFEYNREKTAATLSLNGTYIDLAGNTYQNEVKIAPYSSVLLFKK